MFVGDQISAFVSLMKLGAVSATVQKLKGTTVIKTLLNELDKAKEGICLENLKMPLSNPGAIN